MHAGAESYVAGKRTLHALVSGLENRKNHDLSGMSVRDVMSGNGYGSPSSQGQFSMENLDRYDSLVKSLSPRRFDALDFYLSLGDFNDPSSQTFNLELLASFLNGEIS